MVKGYKNLKVWGKAYKLTLKIYRLTKSFPKKETYGLISQMRRASISIVANIAEGCGKKHRKEFVQFISIAIGSCNELGVYLLLSTDLEYLTKKDCNEVISNQEEISKMLFGLRKSLES